jgi:Leucine-rich repeat (LRR) protein
MKKKSLPVKGMMICFILLLGSLVANAAIPSEERAALIAIYNSTGGDNWISTTGWKGNNNEADGFSAIGTEGSWSGVTVSGDHVTALNLAFYELTGSVPTQIGNLTHLKSLKLNDNYKFNGNLPTEIGNLSALEELNMSDTALSSLPTAIGNLTHLKILDLSYNFNLSLPSELSNLQELEELHLGACNLRTVPSFLGNLLNLKHLDLSYNDITQCPPELGNLTKLEVLHLYTNQLKTLPAEIGNLFKLKELRLEFNSLETLPSQLSNLVELRTLILNVNKLTSGFPEFILHMTKLEFLDLSNNMLTGPIPASIGNMVNLYWLALDANQFTGEIPTGTSNLKKLTRLYLRDNSLEGNIPSGIFGMPQLDELAVSGNKLSGEIPSTIKEHDRFSGYGGSLELSYNALYSDNGAVNDFINSVTYVDNWMDNQNLSPKNVTAQAVTSTAVLVSWSLIPFKNYSGGYEVHYSTQSGEWILAGRTSSKSIKSYTVDGLQPDTQYNFKVRTVTEPHEFNKNQLFSEFSKTVSTSTANIVPVVPIVGTQPPFGSMDLPYEGNNGAQGCIAVSGWALDDVQVTGVKVFNVVENQRQFIGDAVFIEGARWDVAEAYPDYPNNNKAGWGYMMLSNFLPNGGVGTYQLMAVAYDNDGNETVIGSKSVVIRNDLSEMPFGTLDTPPQGGMVSGSTYINWGWALTPQPNTIPVDGSTITVWVDGREMPGHPVYNNYREDIATLFPDYNNSQGAVGYYYLDTTELDNGLHTIQWTVGDDAYNYWGIGSRFFSVQNSQSKSNAQALPAPQAKKQSDTPNSVNAHLTNASYDNLPEDMSSPVRYRTGYNKTVEPTAVFPNENGLISIQVKPMQRIEIHLTDKTENPLDTGHPFWKPKKRSGRTALKGFMMVGESLQSLPTGSTYAADSGVFYWQPGPGFYGQYSLVFLTKGPDGQPIKKRVNITLK